MSKKRALVLFSIYIISLAILSSKLYTIGVTENPELKAATDEQRK